MLRPVITPLGDVTERYVKSNSVFQDATSNADDQCTFYEATALGHVRAAAQCSGIYTSSL